jgi:hypothetical protein
MLFSSYSNHLSENTFPWPLKKLYIEIISFTFVEFNPQDFQRSPHFFHVVDRHYPFPLHLYLSTYILQ